MHQKVFYRLTNLTVGNHIANDSDPTESMITKLEMEFIRSRSYMIFYI
jgi:hypothetical protein